jgi:hypothetical protein
MDESRKEMSTWEETLHLRVTELERTVAAQKRTATMLVIGMVGAVALGVAGIALTQSAVGSGTIVAKEFQLRDDDGAPHGTWRIQEQGTSTFTLNDLNGVERIRLTVLPDGAPGLALADAKGRSRVVLSLLPDLTGSLVFADDDGNTRAVLGLSPDGAATLVFADIAGGSRVGLGLEADGQPTFSLAGQGGAVVPPDTAGAR